MDLAEIQKEVGDGFVYAVRHPTAPLTIYNYSPRAQWEKHWTPATMACRGLIVHDSGKIIARPFSKFFNYEEVIEQIPHEPFEAFEKLDGSLGIIYWNGERLAVATRGSFTSEQSEVATKLLSNYPSLALPDGLTILVEIIYPSNRIVVDYGGRTDLIILAMIKTDTGEEIPYDQLHSFALRAGMPIAKRFDGMADIASIRAFNRDNFEGFVLRFSSGFRCKVKLAEYVRLHRLLTAITPRSVWEELKSGRGITEFIDRVPDEFMAWLRSVEAKIRSDFDAIKMECAGAFRSDFADRKSAAAYITQQKYPGILFKMLDGKDPSEQIWKLIYPPAARAFRCGDESVA